MLLPVLCIGIHIKRNTGLEINICGSGGDNVSIRACVRMLVLNPNGILGIVETLIPGIIEILIRGIEDSKNHDSMIWGISDSTNPLIQESVN